MNKKGLNPVYPVMIALIFAIGAFFVATKIAAYDLNYIGESAIQLQSTDYQAQLARAYITQSARMAADQALSDAAFGSVNQNTVCGFHETYPIWGPGCSPNIKKNIIDSFAFHFEGYIKNYQIPETPGYPGLEDIKPLARNYAYTLSGNTMHAAALQPIRTSNEVYTLYYAFDPSIEIKLPYDLGAYEGLPGLVEKVAQSCSTDPLFTACIDTHNPGAWTVEEDQGYVLIEIPSRYTAWVHDPHARQEEVFFRAAIQIPQSP